MIDFNEERSPEQTSVKQELKEAIKQKLRSPETIIVQYNQGDNAEKRRRSGQEAFIVIDSEDGNTHVVISAVAQGDDINQLGLPKYNFVKVTWFNKTDMSAGQIQFINRRDHDHDVRFTKADTPDLEYFIDTGGINYDPGAGQPKPSNPEVLAKNLIEIINNGHPNNNLTNNALRHLKTEWNAQRITPPNRTQLPPTV